MEVPQYIETLDGRPGSEWNEAERARVINWWCERSQLKLVWYSAARYLGEGATVQDVEDAVSQFYVDFDQVRRSFRPGAGLRFQTYVLHVCFKNYCVGQGKKIRLRRSMETSLEIRTEEGTQFEVDLEDESPDGNPRRRAENRAFAEELSRLLRGPLLPERQKQVFVLRHLEGLSYEEIACRMQVPVGSVKGWLSRAMRAVRTCLVERGWSRWQSES